MEKIIHRFSLDVNKNGVQRTIQGIETGEKYARELRITLRNGRENYEIPSDDSVRAVMYIRKPSSEQVSVNFCKIENDEVVYELLPTDISDVGTTIMQLKLIGSLRSGAEAVLISPRFNLEVWESEVFDGNAEKRDTFTALENALAQAQIAYSGRVTNVEIDENYLITVTFNGGETYHSDALQHLSDKIVEIDSTVEEMAEDVAKTEQDVADLAESVKDKVDKNTFELELSKKVNSRNPYTVGTFTHGGNFNASEVFGDELKYTDYGVNGNIDYVGGGDNIVFPMVKDVGVEIAKLNESMESAKGNIAQNTADIAQNTTDIADLKNRPSGTASLALTSSSPLTSSSLANILGIDASGKSEQITTQTLATVQGNMPTVEVGSAINQTLGTSTTRCVSNIVRLGNGSVLSVTSGFEMYVLYAESENGNIVTANGWLTSRTVTADGFYRIQIRKADNSAITPTSFTLTATSTPTPTNPIEIIDASEEVVARTVNLTDKQNTGSNLALPKALPKGTYTLSFETDMANNSFRLSNSTDTSTNSVSSGVRVSLGGNRYAITLTTTFESNYYSTNASGGTYVRNIQIEEGASATAYTEYASNSITLPYTLRSVGTVADELIVNEDGSGKLIRRVGEVDLGILDYTYTASWGGYHAFTTEMRDVIKIVATNNDYGNIMCDKFSVSTRNIMASASAEGLMCLNTYGSVIFATDTVSSIADFKTAMSGTILRYELATPIETPLTAEEVASIRQLMTYKGTTIIDSEMQIDSVTYSGDVKGYVDGEIASVEAKNIYSTKETLIGYEDDGTPRYRVKRKFTSSGGSWAWQSSLPSGAIVKSINGTISASDGTIYPINFYVNSTLNSCVKIQGDRILSNVGSELASKPCEIDVEYIKSAVSPQNDDGIALLSDEGEVVANE